MKVPKARRNAVVFDCPWTGHQADPDFLLRNSTAPTLIGLRCVKCGCLVYQYVPVLTEAPAAPETPTTQPGEGDANG